MKIHVTGGTRGDVRDLTISIQGSELDIIHLIDDLDWAALPPDESTVYSPASAARLRALRKAITDTVGLVRDVPPTRDPTYGWRTDERA